MDNIYEKIFCMLFDARAALEQQDRPKAFEQYAAVLVLATTVDDILPRVDGALTADIACEIDAAATSEEDRALLLSQVATAAGDPAKLYSLTGGLLDLGDRGALADAPLSWLIRQLCEDAVASDDMHITCLYGLALMHEDSNRAFDLFEHVLATNGDVTVIDFYTTLAVELNAPERAIDFLGRIVRNETFPLRLRSSAATAALGFLPGDDARIAPLNRELARIKKSARETALSQTDLIIWNSAFYDAGWTTLGDLETRGDLELVAAGVPLDETYWIDMTLNRYGLPDRSDHLMERQRAFAKSMGGWDALDPLFTVAAASVFDRQDATAHGLASALRLDDKRAQELVEQLEGMGVVRDGTVAVSRGELLLSLCDDMLIDLMREW